MITTTVSNSILFRHLVNASKPIIQRNMVDSRILSNDISLEETHRIRYKDLKAIEFKR